MTTLSLSVSTPRLHARGRDGAGSFPGAGEVSSHEGAERAEPLAKVFNSGQGAPESIWERQWLTCCGLVLLLFESEKNSV